MRTKGRMARAALSAVLALALATPAPALARGTVASPASATLAGTLSADSGVGAAATAAAQAVGGTMVVFAPGFDLDGAKAMEDLVAPPDGCEWALPACTYARDGYEFAGWSTTIDGRDVADDPLTTADERREAVSLGNGQAMVGLRAKADASGRKPTGPALDLSGDVRDGRLTLYAQWAETAPAGARDASATTGGDAPAEVVPGGRQGTEAAEVAPADGTGENGGGSATGELDGRSSTARAAAVENHQPAAVDDKDSECESPVPDSRQEPSSDETFGIQGVVPPTPAASSETEEMRGVTEGDSAAALASAGMPNLLAASLMLRATANSGGNIVAVGRYWRSSGGGGNILHALSRDGAGLEGYIREHTYYFRDSGSTPIYEARNPYTEDRYYTPSWDEYQALVGAGWVGNGVVFYGGETDVVPVYRVKVRDFDGTGYNLFTPSELESRVAGEFVGIKFYAAAYYVAYDANGGSPTPGTESVAYGEDYKVSATRPTRTGYSFVDWGGFAPGSTVKNLTQNDASTVTLKANWKANAYTVKYNGNGSTGGSTASSSHTYDAAKALTANGFSRTGYTFDGWNTKADGTGTSYANKASVKNLTSASGGTVNLYARWKANSLKVTFDGNGGSIARNGAQTFTSGKGQRFADTGASRPGYTLLGWADGAGAKTAQYETFSGVSDGWIGAGGSRTVYAVWRANSYTVRYDGNGATGGSTASSSHTYDAAKALTANGFTRKAHDFVGWNTRPDGSGTSYADGASVRNLTATAGGTVTLYAQWRAYETGGTTDPRNADHDGDGLGDNIAFTVPATINLVAASDGTLTGPSPEVTYIENLSGFAIRVTAADVDAADGWNVVDDAASSGVDNAASLSVGPPSDPLSAAGYLDKRPVGVASAWRMGAGGTAGARLGLATSGRVARVGADVGRQSRVCSIHWFVIADS